MSIKKRHHFDHFILYNAIKNHSVKQLLDDIKDARKIIIKNIKLTDLIYRKRSLVGVYVIYDKNKKPAYVGKTGSRSILERLAGHYDLRSSGYMNTFLCALTGKKKSRKGPQASDKDIQDVYESSLKYSLVFVSLPDKFKKKIIRLENILCRELKPKLNNVRGKKPYSTETLIKEL